MASSDVRLAEPSDKGQVIRLLRESHTAAKFDFPFSAPHAAALFDSHLSDGLILVLGSPAQGMLLAKTFDHPFGAGLWAKETVWFIRPEARGRAALRMLDAYEEWARSQGCIKIGMASLELNDVSGLYRRKGYSPAETHHIKSLR